MLFKYTYNIYIKCVWEEGMWQSSLVAGVPAHGRGLELDDP